MIPMKDSRKDPTTERCWYNETTLRLTMYHHLPIRRLRSLELAVNNGNNEQHQHRNNCNCYYPIGSHPVTCNVSTIHRTRVVGNRSHLRAIPLNVLTLRSTYPSLCCRFRCVFSITLRCWCRSARVPAPIVSVSSAIL